MVTVYGAGLLRSVHDALCSGPCCVLISTNIGVLQLLTEHVIEVRFNTHPVIIEIYAMTVKGLGPDISKLLRVTMKDRNYNIDEHTLPPLQSIAV